MFGARICARNSARGFVKIESFEGVISEIDNSADEVFFQVRTLKESSENTLPKVIWGRIRSDLDASLDLSTFPGPRRRSPIYCIFEIWVE